jgi:hypothetical protein
MTLSLGHSAKMSFYSRILYSKFFNCGVSLTDVRCHQGTKRKLTGLDPIHTPASAPPTTPAYQATGHNNSSASTSLSPFTTTSANASATYNPATPATTLPPTHSLTHTIHPSLPPLLHYPIHKMPMHYANAPRLVVSRFTSYLIN